MRGFPSKMIWLTLLRFFVLRRVQAPGKLDRSPTERTDESDHDNNELYNGPTSLPDNYCPITSHSSKKMDYTPKPFLGVALLDWGLDRFKLDE